MQIKPVPGCRYQWLFSTVEAKNILSFFVTLFLTIFWKKNDRNPISYLGGSSCQLQLSCLHCKVLRNKLQLTFS